VLIEAVAPVRVVAPEPLGFVPRLRADEDDVETMGEKRRKRYPEIMASHRIRRPTVRQLCASETRNLRTPADSGGLGRQHPVPRSCSTMRVYGYGAAQESEPTQCGAATPHRF
jgi:hypothetical protein